MEEDLALFRYTKQKMDEQPERELSDAVRMIFDTERIDTVAERLAEDAYLLWRYDQTGSSFDAAQWRKTMKDVWLRKGSFPALYQETGIYDKREVAACFLLTAKLSLEEGDKLLDALSTNNQSYESRRLYPLHFKEGFFRLAIAWNHLHGTMRFPAAVDTYLAYEAALLEKLKGRWDNYDDIIHLPHPTSAKHPRMPIAARAAMFSPFAALSGHGTAIKETARLTGRRVELSEEAKAELDMKQQLLADAASTRPEMSVTWFQPDERKDGGEYVTTTGLLKKIDEYARTLIMTDGSTIPLDDVLEIERELFQGLFQNE